MIFSAREQQSNQPSSSATWSKPGTATQTYQAEAFTLGLQEGWADRTVFVLEGPHDHGLQHLLTVTVDPEAGDMALLEYAAMQIDVQQEMLRACQLLKQGHTRLDNGMPAYRALFLWYPSEDRRLFQDQIFVVHEGIAYKLTANLTKKTRKTLGPSIQRAMHSFEPEPGTPVGERGLLT